MTAEGADGEGKELRNVRRHGGQGGSRRPGDRLGRLSQAAPFLWQAGAACAGKVHVAVDLGVENTSKTSKYSHLGQLQQEPRAGEEPDPTAEMTTLQEQVGWAGLVGQRAAK